MKINWDKLRKEYFEECTVELNGIQKINHSANNLFEWFREKLYQPVRSTKANALYWLWMKCLEDETGQSRYDYHEYFKYQFIGIRVKKDIKGNDIIKEPSTKGMLSKPFNEYMRKVQAEALTEFNTTVPLPEDEGYQQFLEHYKDYI